jgi:spore maturation protein CgeB
MRVIIPNYTAPDTFVENVAFTLRAMGHEVSTMPQISTAQAFSQARHVYRKIRSLSSGYVSPEERWLLRCIKHFRPDMILTLTQCLGEECLQETKKLGVKLRVAWWGDSPGNMQRMGLLSEGWDLVFFKDPGAIEKFRIVGLNAFLLHEAMNPSWHKVVASQANDSLVVAGNYYAHRQFLVRRLVRGKVPLLLYGPPPPAWALPEVKAHHLGRFIVKTEKSKIFGEALACLNTTHWLEGNSLNCRAFEIAGAGGLQMMEYRPIVIECFEPGKEVLTFSRYEELLELIERARRFPQDMKKIREAGAKRVLGQHTYRHRLEVLLKTAAGLD